LSVTYAKCALIVGRIRLYVRERKVAGSVPPPSLSDGVMLFSSDVDSTTVSYYILRMVELLIKI
jgi:hypothetical protein